MQEFLDLPYREDFPELLDEEGLVDALQEALAFPGTDRRLWPIQARALVEAMYTGGLVAPIGVGGGKTLISLLLPTVLESKRPLLIVPAPLVKKTLREAAEWSKHFKIARTFKVRSYDAISLQKGWEFLMRYKPDLIVTDEAHNLANKKAARTKKICRYIEEHPSCGFISMSGTLTNRELQEFNHLSFWSLRGGSPLPTNPADIERWGAVINAKGSPSPADFARTAAFADLSDIKGGLQERIRDGFSKRFLGTVGVVATTRSSWPGSVYFDYVDVPPPAKLTEALTELEDYWETPDGDELEYTLEKNNLERQLEVGFYYRTLWGPDGPDEEYLEAKRNWGALVRSKLAYESIEKENYERTRRWIETSDEPLMEERDILKAWDFLVEASELPDEDTAYLHFRQHPDSNGIFRAWRKLCHTHCQTNKVYLDSPLMVFNHFKHHEPYNATFRAWCEVKERPLPPKEAVWITEEIVDRVIEWANKEKRPPIIWVLHDAVLEKFEEKGIPAYGQGVEIPEDRAHLCAAKYRVHGTGKQLQAWGNALILQAPGSGKIWEQIIGRMARPLQEQDEVYINIAGTSLNKASVITGRTDAKYQAAIMKQEQWLLKGDWV